MENVTQINPYERMISWNRSSASMPKKIRKKRPVNRSGRRFYTLSRLASDTHQKLVEKKSPLRLCVYKEEEDVYMDVIAVDKKEKISQSFTRPITHDNLKTLVKQIHNQMGLVLDYSV